jgi:octaheme c-type cytochrome (tetrathionate reductase family)
MAAKTRFNGVAAATSLTAALLILAPVYFGGPPSARPQEKPKAPAAGKEKPKSPPKRDTDSTGNHQLYFSGKYVVGERSGTGAEGAGGMSYTIPSHFNSGPEVTQACLKCHTEAAKQVMKTAHWTWVCPRALEKAAKARGDESILGKNSPNAGDHIVNNFCIALPSNEPRCTSCHAGYGWKDKSFDFEDETLVDCLVCHDTTGKYKKFPTMAGLPIVQNEEGNAPSKMFAGKKEFKPIDLAHIARNVGKPTRANCGTCHFFGGGGEGVKHGDMDTMLMNPDRNLDVHMAVDGANYDCQTCHTTHGHFVAGRCFEEPAVAVPSRIRHGVNENYLACESCHGHQPHPTVAMDKVDGVVRHYSRAQRRRHERLNEHCEKIACQTCHIPTMARQKATKTWWDWSQAGDGKRTGETCDIQVQAHTEGALAEGTRPEKVSTYNKKKGKFIWAGNAVPEYVWFNGAMKHLKLGTPITEEWRAQAGEDLRYRKTDLTRSDLHMFDAKDPGPVVLINRCDFGNYENPWDDPRAKIWPAKIMRGKQPWDDRGEGRLVVPKLFPGKPGEAKYWDQAFWPPGSFANKESGPAKLAKFKKKNPEYADYTPKQHFNWKNAISAGMNYAFGEENTYELPEGDIPFTQTEMIWVLKHTVAPKEAALKCSACHAPEGGRLAALSPSLPRYVGTGQRKVLDLVGIAMVGLSILAALAHGLMRVISSRKER